MSATPQTVAADPLEETPHGNLPVGAQLGAYELGRVLGRGGMGAVYEATHRAVQKRVAIKTLLPHLAASPSSTKRFLREAQAAARVRHPHTVDVTDVGVADGIPFIVMEYLDGEDLGQRIDREGPMTVEAVVDLMLPVCSALMTAHEEGVVHRDLKPENIFLARTRADSEVVKVLDFGISHIAQPAGEARLTQTNSVIGTPHYMAPEQTKGARFADARSDQYSLGVVMYECLTTELPFEGDSFLEILEALATKKVVAPSKRARGIPSSLDAIVLRTLSKDPTKRFASMRELARALLPFASARGRMVWEAAFADGAEKLVDANTLQLRRDATVPDAVAVRPLWMGAALAGAVVVAVSVGGALYLTGPGRSDGAPATRPLPTAAPSSEPATLRTGAPVADAPPVADLPVGAEVPAVADVPGVEEAPSLADAPVIAEAPAILAEPAPSDPPAAAEEDPPTPAPSSAPARPRRLVPTPTPAPFRARGYGADALAPVSPVPGPRPVAAEPRVGPNGAVILR